MKSIKEQKIQKNMKIQYLQMKKKKILFIEDINIKHFQHMEKKLI